MDLTARAGLTLVSEVMLALGLEEVVRTGLEVRRRRRGFTAFDKLLALVLVQAAGGECIEDVRPKRLRYEVFTVPAEIHSHARQLTARLGVAALSAGELIVARGR